MGRRSQDTYCEREGAFPGVSGYARYKSSLLLLLLKPGIVMSNLQLVAIRKLFIKYKTVYRHFPQKCEKFYGTYLFR